MPKNGITAEQEFVINRLKNPTRTSEGPTLPPRVAGSSRVPTVTGLRVVKKDIFLGGTVFTLTWTSPAESIFIDHYNIFVAGLFQNNKAPVGPYAVPASPAALRLVADADSILTFRVQTVLKNGMTSALNLSPTATETILGPTLSTGDLPPTLITDLDLVTGRSQLTDTNRIVLVDSAGKVKELGSLGSTTTLLHGNAAGAPTFGGVSLTADTSANQGTTTTVLHGNAAGQPSFGAVSLTADVTGTLPVGNGGTGATSYTAGSIPFSNGTILTQDNASLFFDDGNNRLGLLTTAPKSTLDVNGSLGVKVVSKAFADTPYTAGTEVVILIDASGGAVTVALPALSGVLGRVYAIKKIDSSINAVTIDGDASENIDGVTTKTLALQYASYTIVAGPSEWSII